MKKAWIALFHFYTVLTLDIFGLVTGGLEDGTALHSEDYAKAMSIFAEQFAVLFEFIFQLSD